MRVIKRVKIFFLYVKFFPAAELGKEICAPITTYLDGQPCNKARIRDHLLQRSLIFRHKMIQ